MGQDGEIIQNIETSNDWGVPVQTCCRDRCKTDSGGGMGGRREGGREVRKRQSSESK